MLSSFVGKHKASYVSGLRETIDQISNTLKGLKDKITQNDGASKELGGQIATHFKKAKEQL